MTAPSLAVSRPPLGRNSVILFEGDSITDCMRDRTRTGPNDPAGLGAGYVGRLAGDLLAENTGADWQFYNRAVSGDRAVDLLARWRRDALPLKPDVVSILVGVNDTWHEHLFGNGIPVSQYAELYAMLLTEIRRAWPSVRIVLGEPFALPGGEFKTAWIEELRERASVARQLAQQFSAAWVPYQSVFDAALFRCSAKELAADGVHPSLIGHRLMVKAWRDTVGL